MKKVLFVIPDAEHSSAATQLHQLARALPREHFSCRVCILGGEGPVAARLRSDDVTVNVLGWKRLLDGRPLLRLRSLLRCFQPDLVHLWRPAALRAVALASAGRSASLGGFSVIVSAPGALRANKSWRPLEQWLLRRADVVAVSGHAEMERCLSLGVPPARLQVVPPGVERWGPDGVLSAASMISHATNVRHVACVGPLEPHKGFYDALWAFDILRRFYKQLNLLLIGAGSDCERLRHFARAVGADEQVNWLGQPDDVRPYLEAAEIVWVPSRSAGGAQVALEAMAAGRPIIASQVPGLVEIVADGQTGFLVPPGDRIGLARQTRILLDNPVLRHSFCEAGRRRALEQFHSDAMTTRFAQLYTTLKSA